MNAACARKFARRERARGWSSTRTSFAELNARIEHDGLPLDERQTF
jgi:post-segregation antitoxin (ccd killing protein)